MDESDEEVAAAAAVVHNPGAGAAAADVMEVEFVRPPLSRHDRRHKYAGGGGKRARTSPLSPKLHPGAGCSLPRAAQRLRERLEG